MEKESEKQMSEIEGKLESSQLYVVETSNFKV